MADKSKNTTKKIIKKPTPFIYSPGMFLVGLFLKFWLRTTYDLSGIKDIKEPSIVVCPHVSNIDFLLVGKALMPFRPTYIVSQHFMVNPKTRWIMEMMHVIPKKMFCPDVKTIMNIMRAKDSGNIIVIFPEGRLTCSGHSVQVTEGTAELIKKLGVDVYCITENGAYKTLPKWGKCGFRRGRIHVTSEKLFSSEEVSTASIDEINAVLDRAILHDEDSIFTDVEYKCKSPAKGLDGILYKCPECLQEFRTCSDDHTIRCTFCGLEARLDNKYELHGGPFKRINDWYKWQEEMLDLDKPLRTDCLLGVVGTDGNMDKTAGSGHIVMDRENITFTGQCYGEPLEFTEPTSVIKAFPASVGDHFDIYSKKVLYYIIPQPDKRAAIKWVQWLDKLAKEKDL